MPAVRRRRGGDAWVGGELGGRALRGGAIRGAAGAAGGGGGGPRAAADPGVRRSAPNRAQRRTSTSTPAPGDGVGRILAAERPQLGPLWKERPRPRSHPSSMPLFAPPRAFGGAGPREATGRAAGQTGRPAGAAGAKEEVPERRPTRTLDLERQYRAQRRTSAPCAAQTSPPQTRNARQMPGARVQGRRCMSLWHSAQYVADEERGINRRRNAVRRWLYPESIQIADPRLNANTAPVSRSWPSAGAGTRSAARRAARSGRPGGGRSGRAP